MLCLAKLFGLNHIDVPIQARSVGAEGNVGVVDCAENGVNPLDLLPTYCPKKSKTFLSAQWAYGITYVGQCFDGGANEFREVLCKYAVERGFNSSTSKMIRFVLL
ncbi:hypothetical protein ACSBR1_016735 [Camellia fascicularis]